MTDRSTPAPHDLQARIDALTSIVGLLAGVLVARGMLVSSDLAIVASTADQTVPSEAGKRLIESLMGIAAHVEPLAAPKQPQ